MGIKEKMRKKKTAMERPVLSGKLQWQVLKVSCFSCRGRTEITALHPWLQPHSSQCKWVPVNLDWEAGH